MKRGKEKMSRNKLCHSMDLHVKELLESENDNGNKSNVR